MYEFWKDDVGGLNKITLNKEIILGGISGSKDFRV
jgi:hypothetical protein